MPVMVVSTGDKSPTSLCSCLKLVHKQARTLPTEGRFSPATNLATGKEIGVTFPHT